MQKYLVFQLVYKHFKMLPNSSTITMWKSKGFLNQSINSPATSDNSLDSAIYYNDSVIIRVKMIEVV